jgi:hypothetical protein
MTALRTDVPAPPTGPQELEVAIEKMNTFNAWEIDGEAKRVLEAVGITDLNAIVDQVGGGGRGIGGHPTRMLGARRTVPEGADAG